MKRKCFALLLIGVMVFTSGCGLFGVDSGGGTIGSSDIETLPDGRETGGYFNGRMGETFSTVFFDFQVKSAYLANEYEGQTPSAGNVFLVSDIYVKNTYNQELPMWSSDFQIQWGLTEEDYGFPIEKNADAQMDDEYALKKGESVTGICVFEVPDITSKHEYSISYLEIYDDGVDGNVFFCYFELDPPSN